jgi:hypothetical protein
MKSKKKTAAEFAAELAANPEYVRQSLRLQEESAQRFAVLEAAALPIVDAINSSGMPSVGSLWQMGDAAAANPRILDILVAHLQRDYPEEVHSAIARAVAVPQARRLWETLLKLFVSHPDGPVPNRTKWAIGCALAASADASVVDDVIALMREPTHGANRAAFLEFLSRSPSPDAQVVFEEAGRDPQFAKEVRFLKRVRQRKWRKRPGKTQKP